MSTPQAPPRGLGWRTLTGISDSRDQINPFLRGTGWDVIFTPQALGQIQSDGEWEVYHLYLDGPVGASVAVLIDGHPWDYVSQGWQNGWDPTQPITIKAGQSLQFCWSVAFFAGPYDATGTAKVLPTVTAWLRLPNPGAVIY